MKAPVLYSDFITMKYWNCLFIATLLRPHTPIDLSVILLLWDNIVIAWFIKLLLAAQKCMFPRLHNYSEPRLLLQF